ncbi:MAG: DUF4268 domain-containing protein [Rhodobacteraceae bacterium]|nr:DUF4268 domain-containing protein [Paracoccaceae bacterium]
MTQLGRLERVDLRAEWSKEDRDFTPWLAQEENIALLGETLKMSLEVEEEERRVGRFSADILCRDTATAEGDWVVIENQLETTDHSHLGQIITYAAGLEAKTCIWVAAKFHEEHRAAIDWLNEITGEGHQFFALEIELWRIGESLSAPKFNIVAQPNDWKRDIGRAAKLVQPAHLSQTKQLQLAFWTALQERLNGHVMLRSRKPLPQHWTTFSIGRSGMHLAGLINTRENRVAVELLLADKNAQSFFEQLRQDEEQIAEETGLNLEWWPIPDSRNSKVITFHSMPDLGNRSSWPELHNWMIETLEIMHTCFAPRVKALVSGEQH